MRRVTIIQGDFLVEREPDVTITTLLGSCVAVCLHDPLAKVGGMNHFLLGAPSEDAVVTVADRRRYGIHAMELLINEMMKQGASRSRMRAHLYGGAAIVAGLSAIGQSNGRFALDFIATEGISLAHSDLGGDRARRIEFRPYDGKARSMFVAAVVPTVLPVAALARHGELELF